MTSNVDTSRAAVEAMIERLTPERCKCGCQEAPDFYAADHCEFTQWGKHEALIRALRDELDRAKREAFEEAAEITDTYVVGGKNSKVSQSIRARAAAMEVK